MEDKATIVASLRRTLKLTDYCLVDLVDAYYSTSGAYLESVFLTWASGRIQEVDVSYDSGIALIKDVLRAIEL